MCEYAITNCSVQKREKSRERDPRAARPGAARETKKVASEKERENQVSSFPF